jgi:cell division GTPase FtsZ
MVIAVVATPFGWEMRRKEIAEEALEEITRISDGVIVLSNSLLEDFAPKDATIAEALALSGELICNAMAGILDMLKDGGELSPDFFQTKAVRELWGPVFTART